MCKWVWATTEAIEGIRSLETGGRGNCAASDVGFVNWTWVLCKISKDSNMQFSIVWVLILLSSTRLALNFPVLGMQAWATVPDSHQYQ